MWQGMTGWSDLRSAPIPASPGRWRDWRLVLARCRCCCRRVWRRRIGRAIWRARRPGIAFDLALNIDDAALGLGLREALYRVAQEALSNAVRHGAPSVIALSAELAGDSAVLKVTDNGAAPHRPGGRPRFGLTGMRARIAALGGELVIDQGSGDEPGKGGWTVTARVPLHAAEPVRP